MCWRYIGLFLLSGWKKEEMNVDIVPLFETVDDLQQAASVMKELYENQALSGTSAAPQE